MNTNFVAPFVEDFEIYDEETAKDNAGEIFNPAQPPPSETKPLKAVDHMKAYSPDQERDEEGKWEETGAGEGPSAKQEKLPGGGRNLVKNIDGTEDDISKIKAVIQKRIPTSHIEKLNKIEVSGQAVDEAVRKANLPLGMTAMAYYDPVANDIYVRPGAINMVPHEIGHSVYHNVLSDANRAEVKSIYNVARQSGKGTLNDRAITSEKEFFAEAYRIRAQGYGKDLASNNKPISTLVEGLFR